MTDPNTLAAGERDHSVLPEELHGWTRSAVDNGLTGAQARSWLTSRGWPAWVGDAAANEIDRAIAESGRSALPPPPPMDASHQHSFAYAVLFVTVGFAALALGSTVHLLLAWAFETRSGSQALADWLTIFVCTVPFAVAAHQAVRRIERDDPMARYSTVRDGLSAILLWAAGVVGGGRLLVFVHQLVSALVVDRKLDELGRDLAHVLTVVVIAGWVFAWTWRLRQAPKT